MAATKEEVFPESYEITITKQSYNAQQVESIKHEVNAKLCSKPEMWEYIYEGGEQAVKHHEKM